jgi:hypothetical protein
MAFNDVIALLKTQRSPFIYLRFLRWAYSEEKKDGDIVDQYFKDKNEVTLTLALYIYMYMFIYIWIYVYTYIYVYIYI